MFSSFIVIELAFVLLMHAYLISNIYVMRLFCFACICNYAGNVQLRKSLKSKYIIIYNSYLILKINLYILYSLNVHYIFILFLYLVKF